MVGGRPMSLIFRCSAAVITLLYAATGAKNCNDFSYLAERERAKRAGTAAVGWAERSEAHAVVPRTMLMGFSTLTPSYVCGKPIPVNARKSRLSGVRRMSRPQALDVAVADRGKSACRAPFADRAVREQRVFAGAPTSMRRGDDLDLARHRRMQRKQRDPGRETLDRFAIALLN